MLLEDFQLWFRDAQSPRLSKSRFALKTGVFRTEIGSSGPLKRNILPRNESLDVIKWTKGVAALCATLALYKNWPFPETFKIKGKENSIAHTLLTAITEDDRINWARAMFGENEASNGRTNLSQLIGQEIINSEYTIWIDTDLLPSKYLRLFLDDVELKNGEECLRLAGNLEKSYGFGWMEIPTEHVRSRKIYRPNPKIDYLVTGVPREVSAANVVKVEEAALKEYLLATLPIYNPPPYREIENWLNPEAASELGKRLSSNLCTLMRLLAPDEDSLPDWAKEKVASAVWANCEDTHRLCFIIGSRGVNHFSDWCRCCAIFFPPEATSLAVTHFISTLYSGSLKSWKPERENRLRHLLRIIEDLPNERRKLGTEAMGHFLLLNDSMELRWLWKREKRDDVLRFAKQLRNDLPALADLLPQEISNIAFDTAI